MSGIGFTAMTFGQPLIKSARGSLDKRRDLGSHWRNVVIEHKFNLLFLHTFEISRFEFALRWQESRKIINHGGHIINV